MTFTNEATDADLRDPVLERLGEGADPSPLRRQALVDRIAHVPAAEAPRRRVGVWWVAAALAAAAVVAGVVLWPGEPEPISPTALLGDLLGPLPTLAAPAPAPPGPEQSPSPMSDVLAAVWKDLGDPLAIVAQTIDLPRVLIDDEPEVIEEN